MTPGGGIPCSHEVAKDLSLEAWSCITWNGLALPFPAWLYKNMWAAEIQQAIRILNRNTITMGNVSAWFCCRPLLAYRCMEHWLFPTHWWCWTNKQDHLLSKWWRWTFTLPLATVTLCDIHFSQVYLQAPEVDPSSHIQVDRHVSRVGASEKQFPFPNWAP